MKVALIIIVAVAALAVAAVLAASVILFIVAICRKKRRAVKSAPNKKAPEILEGEAEQFTSHHDMIRAERRWFEAMPRERVSITSFDGLALSAELIIADYPVGSVLLMHGYRATGFENFSMVLRLYHELGYNILIPSQRASGGSEGRFITYGAKERFDCRDWCKYLQSRFGEKLPVFIHGVSLGSTTVQMASALELPGNVVGIISDCGFTSAWDELSHVLKSYFKLPVFPIMYISNFLTRIFARFDMRETSTVEAMRVNKLPTLFIHGDEDRFVPKSMTMLSFKACAAEKELYIAPGAGHAMSSVVCRDGYSAVLRAFLRKYTASL